MSDEEKRLLRRSIQKEIVALSSSQKRNAASRICAGFIANFSYSKFRIAAGYVPIKNECDPFPILYHLNKKKIKLTLPVIKARKTSLIFREWRYGEELYPGIEYNIPEPIATAKEYIPDLLIIPLVGFDREGYRLGYGGGFYDMTIAELRKKNKITCIGLAYHCQEIERLPREFHDIKLDYVVTDKEVLAF